MRAENVAALYDVHGNAPALAAVLAEVDALGVEAIVVGGDVASGPMPLETMELLERQERPVVWVRGNADRVLDFAATTADDELWRAARLWVADRLGEERVAFLAGLTLDAVVEVEALGPVRFCHGAPGSDELTITRLTPDERLAELLDGVSEPVVVCGHTHVQFDRRAGVRGAVGRVLGSARSRRLAPADGVRRRGHRGRVPLRRVPADRGLRGDDRRRGSGAAGGDERPDRGTAVDRLSGGRAAACRRRT